MGSIADKIEVKCGREKAINGKLICETPFLHRSMVIATTMQRSFAFGMTFVSKSESVKLRQSAPIAAQFNPRKTTIPRCFVFVLFFVVEYSKL